MAAINRDACIKLILKLEGGEKVTRDQRDPGGTTKYGISQRAYPNLDIENLTENAAVKIYGQDYWNKVSGDAIRSGLDLLVFDCAVNQGPEVAARLLQVASGAPVDGVIGPNTLAASAMPGIMKRFAKERVMRYATNPMFNVYGNGWINRIFTVFEKAVEISR